MTITVLDGAKRMVVPFIEGDTVHDALQRENTEGYHAPCGGKGICKKCNVYVTGDEFCGRCLSCTTKASDGMTVEVTPIVRISVAESSNAAVYSADENQSGYAVVCDIGTITVLCMLVSLETGKCVATISGSNSQSIFGANVLSRLQAAAEGNSDKLTSLIISQINKYIESLCRETGISTEEVKRISVSGNTIMEHLFAGLNPAENGISPFKPASLFGEEADARSLGLCFDGTAFICPCVSGFVGGDIVSGMIAAKMPEAEKPVLFADLGANSELILGCGERYVACTADAGAAFKASLLDKGMTASAGAVSGVEYEDGRLKLTVLGDAKPVGVCGSGMIDALGIMYRLGVLDEMGHIVPAEEVPEEIRGFIGVEDGSRVFYLTENKKVYITQSDISKFQLAKAAISAGIQILAEEYGIRMNEISKVCLAGGFGAFVRPQNAAAIGLIPAELLEKAEKLGNTSVAGAHSAAVSAKARENMKLIRDKIRYINLPTHPSFGDAYVDGMMFE